MCRHSRLFPDLADQDSMRNQDKHRATVQKNIDRRVGIESEMIELFGGTVSNMTEVGVLLRVAYKGRDGDFQAALDKYATAYSSQKRIIEAKARGPQGRIALSRGSLPRDL